MVIFSWLCQSKRWLTVNPCRQGQGESVSVFHPDIWPHVDPGVPAHLLASLEASSSPWGVQAPRPLTAPPRLRPEAHLWEERASPVQASALTPSATPAPSPWALQRPRSSARAHCPATHTSFGNECPVNWRQSPRDPLIFSKSLVFLNQESNVDPFTSPEGKK